jgi:tetratricopeptide (TPR) repeat protein
VNILLEEEFTMSQFESILIVDDEFRFAEKLNRVSRTKNRQRVRESFPSSGKSKGIIEKLNYIFKREEFIASKELEFYSKLVKRQPNNTKAHLKMAELYQKKKDHPKSVAEYLTAAELCYKNSLFPQAMAIYKQVLKQSHGLDQVHLKIADIYRQMGFLGDAFYRYNLLLQHYNTCGEKEKAIEVMGLMAELDPRKFTIEENHSIFENNMVKPPIPNEDIAENFKISAMVELEKEKGEGFYNLGAAIETGSPLEFKGYHEISMENGFGFKEILAELKETAGPSKAYPKFNYHMGVACREMGFIDEAIEQFQVALEKEQNPFEAAKSLSWCYKEKGWWEEARQTLEKAMQIEGVTEEKMVVIKKELDIIIREIEKEREILGSLSNLSLERTERSDKKMMRAGLVSDLEIQESVST